MIGEQELQDRYGLSGENLKWVKNSFMKVLRNFLNKNQIDINFEIEAHNVQTDIETQMERIWEEACLELITHLREYCLMDTPPLDSYVKNFAWGLDAIIKVRLEMNFRLESQGLQPEKLSSDWMKAEFEIKKKQLEIIDEKRLNLDKRHRDAVDAAPVAARQKNIDRKEEKLERLVLFSQISSKMSSGWLKIPAAIITGSLLFFALFGQALTHSNRFSTKAQAPLQMSSTQNSAHTQ